MIEIIDDTELFKLAVRLDIVVKSCATSLNDARISAFEPLAIDDTATDVREPEIFVANWEMKVAVVLFMMAIPISGSSSGIGPVVDC